MEPIDPDLLAQIESEARLKALGIVYRHNQTTKQWKAALSNNKKPLPLRITIREKLANKAEALSSNNTDTSDYWNKTANRLRLPKTEMTKRIINTSDSNVIKSQK